MERESALHELATAHAVALRMRWAGASDESIATALAVPVESLPSLLAIAEAKLKALMAQNTSNHNFTSRG